MLVGIINRMILIELIKVFLMSLAALTGMFLLGGLIQEATQKGLSPAQIIVALPLIIPNTFPYTIPATTLFATCVVYGRMSADNEILVLRAAGANIYHLLWPAIVLGLMTTAVTGALYYDPIPRSQRLLREQLTKDAEGILYSLLKREGGMRGSNLDFVLYVRDVQGRDLIDVVVKKRKPDKTGFELVARAQTAQLYVRKVVDSGTAGAATGTSKSTAGGTKPGIERTELVVSMERCFVDSLKGGGRAELQHQEYATPLPESIFGRDTRDRPTAQTWQELYVRLGEAIQERDAAFAAIDVMEKKGAAPSGVPGKTFAELARDQRSDAKGKFGPGRMARQVETEIQMRPALAVGCMCFVLIGCPVGIWANRSDYLSVFMICFLPTVFVYYPILLATLNMAKDGKGPPTIAWAANALLAACSLVLIRRLMKR